MLKILSLLLSFVWASQLSAADFTLLAGYQGNSDFEISDTVGTAPNVGSPGDDLELAGVGAGFFSPADKSLRDVTKFSAQIAGGANYKFSGNLLLRLEARWIPTFFNGSASGICSGGCTVALKSDVYSQFQANVGLQFRF